MGLIPSTSSDFQCTGQSELKLFNKRDDFDSGETKCKNLQDNGVVYRGLSVETLGVHAKHYQQKDFETSADWFPLPDSQATEVCVKREV